MHCYAHYTHTCTIHLKQGINKNRKKSIHRFMYVIIIPDGIGQCLIDHPMHSIEHYQKSMGFNEIYGTIIKFSL